MDIVSTNSRAETCAGSRSRRSSARGGCTMSRSMTRWTTACPPIRCASNPNAIPEATKAGAPGEGLPKRARAGLPPEKKKPATEGRPNSRRPDRRRNAESGGCRRLRQTPKTAFSIRASPAEAAQPQACLSSFPSIRMNRCATAAINTAHFSAAALQGTGRGRHHRRVADERAQRWWTRSKASACRHGFVYHPRTGCHPVRAPAGSRRQRSAGLPALPTTSP